MVEEAVVASDYRFIFKGEGDDLGKGGL